MAWDSKRAGTDQDKDEILLRLRLVWQANPSLRLMQLIGNVFRDKAGTYNIEDYDMIEELERAYRELSEEEFPGVKCEEDNP